MKRIIIHWTGGAGSPNALEKQHYHFLIDSQGTVHKGVFAPEANEKCVEGRYAAHVGGGNTGSIGVALCGMNNWPRSTKYLLTFRQLVSAFSFIASLCAKYSIDITPTTVLTHYEFGRLHPETSSGGKIDISFLPPFPSLTAQEIGPFFRERIVREMQPKK